MMRHMPTEPSAAGTSRSQRIVRRLGLASGLLALFIAFEIGIRHMAPDGMTVTYDYNAGSIGIGTRTYTAPNDQQTIRDTYTAFNAAPVVRAPVGELAGCSLTPDPSQVVFTWHGVPVEAWTSVGCAYVESAGGISDGPVVDEHYVLHAAPHITMPLPLPNEG